MNPQKTKKTFTSTKYGAVALAVSAATAITLFVSPFRSDAIYFPFLTAVVFSSLFGGWRLGILATILSLFIGSLFIFNESQNTPTTEWFILFAFGLASGFTVLLCHNQMSMEMARLVAEAKYRAIFEDSITGIYETTLDGRYVTANPKLAQIIGFDSPESMIRNTLDLGQSFYVKPNRRTEFIELVKEKENLVAFESEIFRCSGEKIWISENALAVRDKTGNLTGFQGTTIDITDRKRAEAALLEAQEQLESKVAERTRELAEANEILRAEIVERMRVEAALRQSEEKFRAIVEVSSDCIWEVDTEGKYTFITPQMENVVGFTPEELLGRTPYSLMSPEEARRIIDYLIPIAAARQSFSFMENANFHKNGEVVITETSGVPIFDSNGEYIGYRGIVRNITERKRTAELLRQSEEKFRNLVETTTDWIWETDAKGFYTYASPQINNLIGYSPEEIIGKRPYDLMPPAEAERVKEFVKRLTATKSGYQLFETVQLHFDGSLVTTETSAIPFFDEAGNLLGSRGIARNISERKRDEEMVKESREMLKLVMDTIPQGVFWKDVEGVFIGCNRYVAECAGLMSGDQIIGLTDYDLPWTKEESDSYRECDRRVMQTGVAELGIVETLQQSNGNTIWLETNKVPLTNATGKTVGVLGTFQDITDRKLAQAALNESEFRLSSVVTAAPVVLFTIDTQGIFTLSEGNGLQLLGLQGGEIVGKSVFDLYRDFPDLLADLQRVLRGEFFSGTVKVGDLTFESRYTPIFDENGTVIEAVGVSIDITDRKRIETELVESQKQLRRLSAHLESVREEERKYIARELHDELGQTLTALKIDLTRLSEKIAKSKTESINRQFYERLPAMIAIVDEAMDTTKRIVIALRPGVLDELGFPAALEWQVQDFQKRVGVKCELTIDFEERKLQPTLNTALFRILQECLTNITRHAAATHVKIELKERDGFLTLTIEDDGRGIGKKKTDNTKSFGISGMRERAILLDGTFEISRPEKGGTRITVKIPMSNDWSDV